MPTWPRITAQLFGDGRAELGWTTTPTEISAPDDTAATAAIIAESTRLAERLRRPVRLDLTDADETQRLAVHPSGRLEEIAAPRAAKKRPRRAANVPANPPEPPPNPSTPRMLMIEIEELPPVVLAAGAAIGRAPSPVDGRIPVSVLNEDQTVSRTHALVDLDRWGRILITDYHSTHGVHLPGQPPRALQPGVPYLLGEGTQVRLGDVACRLSTRRVRARRTDASARTPDGDVPLR